MTFSAVMSEVKFDAFDSDRIRLDVELSDVFSVHVCLMLLMVVRLD